MLDIQHQNIIRLKERHNWSWVMIGKAVDESADAVRMFYNKYKRDTEIGPIPKLPRRRKIGGVNAVKVYKKQIQNPKMSFRKMASWITAELGIDISHQGVADFFKEQDFVPVEAVRIPTLSQASKRKRLEFANLFFDDVDFIRNVWWSDETIISCDPDKRKITTRLPKTLENTMDAFVPKQQGGGFKVMFWGCFSFWSRGPLSAITEKINADEYLKLVKNVIEAELDASPRSLTFMQDHAAHKQKKVMEYFAQKHIQVLNWPPQSPDINPIELIWAIIEQKLYSENSFPNTKDELITRVYKIWNDIPEETLERLCNGVIHRLRTVVVANGG
jgi:transposase